MEIRRLASFKIIGKRWEGSYEEVSALKEIIEEVAEQRESLENLINPEAQWGLSFHIREGGFAHYSGFEITSHAAVPEGYTELSIPANKYLYVHHPQRKNVGDTYSEIYKWFNKHKYQPFVEPNVIYYDDLPLKFERYPIKRSLSDPHFDVYIPIS